MQTGEYKHKQTKRFPLALITVQLGEFMVGMHFNTLLCLSVEIVNITECCRGDTKEAIICIDNKYGFIESTNTYRLNHNFSYFSTKRLM